jgi:DNA-binding IclR family transcriptional regulator
VDHPDLSTHTATSTSTRKEAPVKSAGRVLDLIEELAAAPEGLPFGDLSRHLGLPKSSLHGLLTVLTERGYVAFDPEQRMYSLGIRVWEAGQAYVSHHNLEREALPVMRRVVEAINETVQLAVLDGIENVYLAKVDCSHPLRLQSEIGKRLHAHATGLGKVLLAFLPPDELRDRLAGQSLPLFTSNTIRDLDTLLPTLDEIRRRGFAMDNQEYTPGLVCVAVPIFDRDDRVPVALSASIPLSRAAPEQLAVALRSIAAASVELSHRLGKSRPDSRLATLATGEGAAPPPEWLPAQGGALDNTMRVGSHDHRLFDVRRDKGGGDA